LQQATTVWTTAVALVAGVGGCQAKRAEPGSGAPSASAPALQAGSATVTLSPREPAPLPAAELAKVYLDCFEAHNRGEFEQLAACYAEDAVGRRFQQRLLENRGRDAVLAAGPKSFRDSFSDGKVVPQVVLVRGPEVAMWAVQSGTHSGPLSSPRGEVESTGKAIGQLVLHHARFDKDKRIHEEWFAQDLGTTLFQLGSGAGSGRLRDVQGLVQAPVVIVATPDDAERPGAELVQRRLQALAQKNFAAAAAVLSDSVVESDQAAAADVNGKSAVNAVTEAFWGPLSGARLTCPALWGAGQYVLARCALSADRAANAGGALARTFFELYEVSGSSIQRIMRFSTDGSPAAPK
jgi:hypothetical protein